MDFEKTKVASSIEYSVKGLPAAAAAESNHDATIEEEEEEALPSSCY